MLCSVTLPNHFTLGLLLHFIVANVSNSLFSKFQAVVEQTPPSLRKAPPTGQALEEAPRSPGAGLVLLKNIPPALANIPGINPEHLTEADLLLADPATHTHPLGSHSLLPIHPGFKKSSIKLQLIISLPIKLFHLPMNSFIYQQIISLTTNKVFDSLTSKLFSYLFQTLTTIM